MMTTEHLKEKIIGHKCDTNTNWLNYQELYQKIGTATSKTPPDIIGVCEVENIMVLQDLVNHPNLRSYDYGIVHFDSPDERGIDVALLYRKQVFIPTTFDSRRLLLSKDNGKRDYTRDQLVVEGLLDNEKTSFYSQPLAF